jgi:peroxiredoxin
MKLLTFAVSAMLLAFAAPANAAPPVVNQAAPDFTATDLNGTTVTLSELKGKTVVLEWTNPECPFVVKQYDSKVMQGLQEKAAADGVVWIAINSSAEGKEGYHTADETKTFDAGQGAKYAHKILDTDGKIGKLYDAKTTPHMFVINAEGNLVYQGAIDDNSSPRVSDAATAKNYVAQALAELKDGKTVTEQTTQPYGCGVKYAD